MKKIFIFSLLGLFLFISKANYAQNEMFKALFMYNFSKNIDWPSSYKQGDFVIGVVGNSPVIKELQRIASRKKTGNQRIVVRHYNSVSQIGKCHMVYLPPGKSSYLPSAIKQLAGKPTAIISDGKGLARKGACINYVTVNGDQKFEINEANIRKRGLKVSSFLLSLGIKVQ